MMAVDIQVLEAGAEWRGADMADPETWTVRLTDDDIAELDAALAHAKARTEHVLEITRADFPLPTLAARLAEIEARLIDGAGFVRIRGLPVDRLGDDDACRVYWGLGQHLGRPWPQNKDGHLLGDVIDQGRSPGDPTSRGNELGSIGLPYHSDGSDLVGLLCLRQAKSGGLSRLANAVAVHNTLVRERPDLAADLYQPVPYDFRGEEAPGRRPFYFMPVFTRHDERLFVRYIRPFIESSARHAEAPALSAKTLAAFDAVDELCADPDYHVFMELAPGDMQFVNNYHILHGRSAYEDDAATGHQRHLKRLWLETSRLRSRPDYFQRRRATSHWWDQAERARA